MRTIKGDLGLMELPELLQWAEMGQKDGTLVISGEGASRYFFFQNGLLIYFFSKREGEQLGETLVSGGFLSRSQLIKGLNESKKLGIPFVTYLIANNMITEESVCQALNGLIKAGISDILQWQEGFFEFKESIPESVLNGPVQLNASQLLFRSAVEHDEAGEEGDQQTEKILEDFKRRIDSGRIELPPTPDMMEKLNRISQDDSISFKKIGKIIMADQILASKILKVVNSPFYNLVGEITSLSRAISTIGLSSVKSIAMAHALGQMGTANHQNIRPVLQHSLLTAFIAKIFAPLMQLNPEESFVCGILHDIGKTVLINLLQNYDLEASHYDRLVKTFHTDIGYQVTKAWKFSSVVQETVRLHHTPALAKQSPKQTLLIHIANRIAHDKQAVDSADEICKIIKAEETKVMRALQQIDKLRDSAGLLV